MPRLEPTFLYSGGNSNNYTFGQSYFNVLVIVAGDKSPATLTSTNSSTQITQISSVYGTYGGNNYSVVFHLIGVNSGDKITTNERSMQVYNLGTTRVKEVEFTILKTLNNYQSGADYEFDYTVQDKYDMIFANTLMPERDTFAEERADIYYFGTRRLTIFNFSRTYDSTNGFIASAYQLKPQVNQRLNIFMDKWAYIKNGESAGHAGVYIGINVKGTNIAIGDKQLSGIYLGDKELNLFLGDKEL